MKEINGRRITKEGQVEYFKKIYEIVLCWPNSQYPYRLVHSRFFKNHFWEQTKIY